LVAQIALTSPHRVTVAIAQGDTHTGGEVLDASSFELLIFVEAIDLQFITNLDSKSGFLTVMRWPQPDEKFASFGAQDEIAVSLHRHSAHGLHCAINRRAATARGYAIALTGFYEELMKE